MHILYKGYCKLIKEKTKVIFLKENKFMIEKPALKKERSLGEIISEYK